MAMNRFGLIPLRAMLLALGLMLAGAGTVTAGFKEGVEAYQRGDYAAAIAEWQPLAEAGDPSSLLGLGLIYHRGQGVKIDQVRAARLIERAALLGEPKAELQMAEMYAEGTGVKRDREMALVYLQRAAARGNQSANTHILLTQLIEWFEAVDGKQSIPRHFDDGVPLKSFHYYLLGDAYRRGWWVQVDQRLALKLLEIGASKGSAKAAFLAGEAYEYGEGVKQDWEQAVKFYQQAVTAEHSEAYYRLGLAQHFGNGIPADEASSFRNLSMAAEAGIAGAQFMIAASRLEDPSNVMVSDEIALNYLKSAAGQNYVEALLALGVVYDQGLLGVPRDFEVSFKFFLDAAEHGMPGAQHNVAVAYQMGQGVTQDATLARQYYQRAAESGFIVSVVSLALLEKEYGERWVDSLGWFYLARRLNPSPDYREFIDEEVRALSGRLTEKDISTAMNKAEKFLVRIESRRQSAAKKPLITGRQVQFGSRDS